MKEIWKDIEDYKGLYQVSNLGRVKSLSKQVHRGFCTCWVKEQILTPRNQGHYYSVMLFKGSKKNAKQIYIHRLVAKAFIKNYNHYKEVDHIDGNSYNNNVNNLRWVSHKINENNPNTKWRSKRLKRVAIYSINDKIIKKYRSMTEASLDMGIKITKVYYYAQRPNTVYAKLNIKIKYLD